MNLDTSRSRIRALLVNSGKYSFTEADRRLASSTVEISLSDEAARTVAGQAAFLTAVVTACRCFGHATISGSINTELRLPIPLSRGTASLRDAAEALGGRFEAANDARRVTIGRCFESTASDVCAWWDGWTAGTAPLSEAPSVGSSGNVLAGIVAGGLAVGQAFLAEQGDVRAGRTRQAISLWNPCEKATRREHTGPTSFSFPSSLWFIGLGNLGQAYLWSLSMLPFADPSAVSLYFQDDDHVEDDNWGTSVIVERGRIGMLKTRLAEEWAERRGFRAYRIDRRLDEHLRRTDREPQIAVAGLDGMPARRLLGKPGFDFVIDAGLGASAADYRKFRINTFERGRDPASHYEVATDNSDEVSELMKLPAYRELAESHDDGGCGAAILAGKNVAVPFVSAVVGALTIAQAARLASGEGPCATLTGDTGSLDTVRGVGANPPTPGSIASVRMAFPY